jgi:hypothetical protein
MSGLLGTGTSSEINLRLPLETSWSPAITKDVSNYRGTCKGPGDVNISVESCSVQMTQNEYIVTSGPVTVDASSRVVLLLPQGSSKQNDTKYRTIDRVDYSFSGVFVESGKGPITLTVTSGTITIQYPDKDEKERWKETIDVTKSAIMGQVNEQFKMSTLQSLQSLVIVFIKDALILLIFWVLLLTLGAWFSVEAKLVYPFDLNSFPFVSMSIGTDHNLSVSDEMSGSYCSTMSEEQKKQIETTLRGIEREYEKDPTLKQKVQILNPVMASLSATSIPRYILSFHQYCSTTSNTDNAASVFLYWLSYLILHQYVYSNFLLFQIHQLFHQASAIVPEKGVGVYVFVVLFAVLLLGTTFAMQPFNLEVQKQTKEYFSDFPTSFKESFVSILTHIASLGLFVLSPLFVILFITAFIGNAYALVSIMFNSNSVECMFLSFVAIMASIQFIFNIIALGLEGNFKPNRIFHMIKGLFDTSSIGVKEIIIFIGSFFGILLPFMTSLQFSLTFIGTWFVSAASFLPLMKNTLNTFSMSLILVLLYMLVYDTEKILGPYFSFMTGMIIILFFGLSYVS